MPASTLHLHTTAHIQGKHVTHGLVSLLSPERRDVLDCGPNPSTASPATPGGAKPLTPEVKPGAQEASSIPARATRPCAQGKCLHQDLGWRTSFTTNKLHDLALLPAPL